MSDTLAKLYETQQSLTEWLQDIKHKDVDIIRREDNEKRERLRVLNEVIGLPFDKPIQFEAVELDLKNKKFKNFFEEKLNELCALRLIPKEDALPKLRMRGKTIEGAFSWFCDQDIDPSKYRADFVPHAADNGWATIFVVNKNGIFGEIIYGGHHQLTQGFHETASPSVFSYDFKKWDIHPRAEEALQHVKKLAAYIQVSDSKLREKLEAKLGSTFAHNYLEGYFETSESSAGVWFIDYSPSLGKMYDDTPIIHHAIAPTEGVILEGLSASSGTATGQVVLVDAENITDNFPVGGILVCEVTTPLYVPHMQKAAAIVTDQGGILSHAAIIARELKKPCIVATQEATKKLANGQVVNVDANKGTVRLG